MPPSGDGVFSFSNLVNRSSSFLVIHTVDLYSKIHTNSHTHAARHVTKSQKHWQKDMPTLFFDYRILIPEVDNISENFCLIWNKEYREQGAAWWVFRTIERIKKCLRKIRHRCWHKIYLYFSLWLAAMILFNILQINS